MYIMYKLIELIVSVCVLFWVICATNNCHKRNKKVSRG